MNKLLISINEKDNVFVATMGKNEIFSLVKGDKNKWYGNLNYAYLSLCALFGIYFKINNNPIVVPKLYKDNKKIKFNIDSGIVVMCSYDESNLNQIEKINYIIPNNILTVAKDVTLINKSDIKQEQDNYLNENMYELCLEVLKNFYNIEVKITR